MALTPSFGAPVDLGSGENVYGIAVVSGRVIALAYSKLFYSDDAGATWTPGATRAATGDTGDSLGEIDGAAYVRLAGNDSVYKTTDGASLTLLTGVTRVYGGGAGVVVGLHEGAIKRSLDGGATWSAVTISGALQQIAAGGGAVVGLSPTGGTYRSTDGGATFTSELAADGYAPYQVTWSSARGQFVLIRGSGPILVSATGLSASWASLNMNGYEPYLMRCVPGATFDLFPYLDTQYLTPFTPAETMFSTAWDTASGKFGAYAGAGKFVFGPAVTSGGTASTSVFTVTVTSDTPLPNGNDSFSTPVVLSGTSGSVSTNTAGDTTQAGEPAGAVNTVWYQITPASSKRLSLDLAGSFPGAVAEVFVGTAVNALTPVTPVLGGYPLSAGTAYHIRVGGTSGGGDVAMAWVLTDPPATSPNDNFADAIALIGATGSVSGNATNDTIEPGEPADALQTSVWYSYTPGENYGRLDLTDATFEHGLYAFTGSTVGALSEYAGNSSWSHATIRGQTGQVYRIQVGVDASATTPTTTGFSVAWQSSPLLPAPVSPDLYLVLQDALTGSGALDGSSPTTVWPPYGKWLTTPGLSRAAGGITFTGDKNAFVETIQEGLDTFAFDASMTFKFSKAEMSSHYATMEVAGVSVSVLDYGSGPAFYLTAGALSLSAPFPGTPTSGELANLRLRAGRGKIEVVTGYTVAISHVWDNTVASGLAQSGVLRLSGTANNEYSGLVVYASTVDLPPISPPVAPDGAFWGGFINATETLQVL